MGVTQYIIVEKHPDAKTAVTLPSHIEAMPQLADAFKFDDKGWIRVEGFVAEPTGEQRNANGHICDVFTYGHVEMV